MAQLPSPSDVRRAAPSASMGIAQQNAGIEGAAAARLGQTIAQTGGELARMVAEEERRISSAKVEMAANEFKQRKALLTYGEDGYQARKGANVVVTPKDGEPFLDSYQKRLKQAADESGVILNTEAEREAFNTLVGREATAFQAELLQHSMRETEAFKAQAADGAIKLNTDQAALHAFTPERLADNFAEVNRVYDQMVVNDGIPADKVAAMRLGTLNSMHTSVLNEMLAKQDVETAKAYFEAAVKRNEIAEPEKVRALLENKTREVRVTTAVDEGFATLYPLGNERASREDGVRVLKEKLPDATPAERTAFLNQWDDMTARRRDDLAGRDSAVYAMLIDGQEPARVLASPEFNALSLEDKNKVKASLGTPAGYKQLARVDALLSAPQTLAKMSRPEVLLYAQRHAVGLPAAQRLLDAHTELQKPNAVKDYEADNANLKYAFIAAGEDVPKENDERFIRAKIYMRDALFAAQQAQSNGVPLTPAQKKAIYAEAMKEYITSPGFFWDTKKPRYEMTDEEIGAAQALGSMPR